MTNRLRNTFIYNITNITNSISYGTNNITNGINNSTTTSKRSAS